MDRPAALTPPTTPIQRAWHKLRDNSPRGSKRNIAEHYDLGNDFYRLWLDDTMAYSSAMFCESDDLRSAQLRKWDHLLDLLQPGAKDRMLEIGCGWGGFALHAAQQSGCRVTGVTLSEEQHAWATNAVAEAGLEDRVDIRLQDYRAVPETYSAIASIEMFEAVGERWWPVFFQRLRDLLTPGGAAALQTITIDEARFDDYRRKPDFIQRYIFPGGMLPSPERFRRGGCMRSGLGVAEQIHFGDELREDACRVARRASKRPSRACSNWASTSGSCACGATTSPTAEQASMPRRSTSCRSGSRRSELADRARWRSRPRFPLCRSGTYSAPLA